MRKRIKIKIAAGIFVLVLAIILIGIFNSNEEDLEINDGFSNVDEPHYAKMPITYSLNVSTPGLARRANEILTDEYKKERIRAAFSIIENATGGRVRFEEISDIDKADMRVYGVNGFVCENITGDPFYSIEGFAGPVNITDNLITKSSVVYCALPYALTEVDPETGRPEDVAESDIRFDWGGSTCRDFPVVEIHEILHALGFDHSFKDSKKIMYPIASALQSCQQDEIDEEIIPCLNYIYSNGQEGTCSEVAMYPWVEDPSKNATDFAWGSLPITYSVQECIDLQKGNIEKAIALLENKVGYDLYRPSQSSIAQVNFYCNNSASDTLLNWDTDMWTTTDYFPAAQPEYIFDESGIKEVKINLFGQNRKCGGIELHELLHGLGLRDHYGRWMYYEKEVCSYEGVIDTDSIDALKELYGLS